MEKLRMILKSRNFVLFRNIVMAELVFGITLTLVSIYLDLEVFYEKLPLPEIFSFQLVSALSIVIVELLIVVIIFMSWVRNNPVFSKKSEEVILELIKKGENQSVEFKETFRWDTHFNKINKELDKVIIKTISTFLNSKGGNLIIGVSDEGIILGLNRDYETLPKKNKDGFENYLIQQIKQNIGMSFMRFININFVKLEEREVCHVKIKKAVKPAFIKVYGLEELYIRSGNTSNSLSISEAIEYIENTWPKKN